MRDSKMSKMLALNEQQNHANGAKEKWHPTGVEPGEGHGAEGDASRDEAPRPR